MHGRGIEIPTSMISLMVLIDFYVPIIYKLFLRESKHQKTS